MKAPSIKRNICLLEFSLGVFHRGGTGLELGVVLNYIQNVILEFTEPQRPDGMWSAADPDTGGLNTVLPSIIYQSHFKHVLKKNSKCLDCCIPCTFHCVLTAFQNLGEWGSVHVLMDKLGLFFMCTQTNAWLPYPQFRADLFQGVTRERDFPGRMATLATSA